MIPERLPDDKSFTATQQHAHRHVNRKRQIWESLFQPMVHKVALISNSSAHSQTPDTSQSCETTGTGTPGDSVSHNVPVYLQNFNLYLNALSPHHSISNNRSNSRKARTSKTSFYKTIQKTTR